MDLNGVMKAIDACEHAVRVPKLLRLLEDAEWHAQRAGETASDADERAFLLRLAEHLHGYRLQVADEVER